MKNPFRRNVEVSYTETDTVSTLDEKGHATRPGTTTQGSFIARSKTDAAKKLDRRSRGGDVEVSDITTKGTWRRGNHR